VIGATNAAAVTVKLDDPLLFALTADDVTENADAPVETVELIAAAVTLNEEAPINCGLAAAVKLNAEAPVVFVKPAADAVTENDEVLVMYGLADAVTLIVAAPDASSVVVDVPPADDVTPKLDAPVAVSTIPTAAAVSVNDDAPDEFVEPSASAVISNDAAPLPVRSDALTANDVTLNDAAPVESFVPPADAAKENDEAPVELVALPAAAVTVIDDAPLPTLLDDPTAAAVTVTDDAPLPTRLDDPTADDVTVTVAAPEPVTSVPADSSAAVIRGLCGIPLPRRAIDYLGSLPQFGQTPERS